ncbi:NAD(P)H-binding protein [Nocardia sp. NPDC127579]|uniref:NAD(P)H-binding protein n=1 Tax=Nocardia sp. NPDC127579 TaxID=3345402 RepID=UPI0036281CB0
MILVTGATGTIGSEVVRQLAERDVKVRAVTRDPGRAQAPAGVEVVRGDYRDGASMAAAFDGAEAVFLVSVLGPDDVNTDRALVEAARDAGVRRVVKLSAIGTGESGLGDFSTWHLPGENAVRDSGLEWTVLRPSSFASNTVSWAEAVRAGQPVPNLTGAGTQGVIDPRDVAAVAVEALVSPAHSGHLYTLTGPELLSGPDQAAIIGEVLGCPVAVTDVPHEIAAEQMRAAGMSPEYVDGALAGQAYVRSGGNAVLTEDVRVVLGHAPRVYREWVADHRGAFVAE